MTKLMATTKLRNQTRSLIHSGVTQYLASLYDPNDDIAGIGGNPSTRSIHVIFVLDRSGSMGQHGRMEKVNNAVDTLSGDLRGIQDSYPNVAIKVSVLSFANTVSKMYESPIDVLEFKYRHLAAGGMTNLAAPLWELSDMLHKTSNPEHAGIMDDSKSVFPPVIVFMSDGLVNGESYDAVLEELRHNGYFMSAARVGIAIDNESLRTVLEEVTGCPGTVFNVKDDREISKVLTKCLKASVEVSSKTGPALGGITAKTATEAVAAALEDELIDDAVELGSTQPWCPLFDSTVNNLCFS